MRLRPTAGVVTPRKDLRRLGWAITTACLVAAWYCLAAPAASTTAPAPFVDYVPARGEPGDADVTDAERASLAAAAAIVNTVRSSDCFRGFIASRALVETLGRSSGEVAAHLQTIRGVVPVAFYYRCDSLSATCQAPTQAVAYRQPPEVKIFINRAHFDVARSGFDSYELAGTLAHEALGHLLGGYGHPFAWTPSRDFSVPYSISGASRANDDAFRHCRGPLGY